MGVGRAPAPFSSSHTPIGNQTGIRAYTLWRECEYGASVNRGLSSAVTAIREVRQNRPIGKHGGTYTVLQACKQIASA
jgi:hypothetical protein